MILNSLNILNFKNIQEADLHFSERLNCLVGLNGQGKTNLLDAIYYLSFTKSSRNPIDSQNIMHGQDMAIIQGTYTEDVSITCGLRRGVKKQFRRGKKEYKRLLDHIGLIPLVMVSPDDQELIQEGSEARRKFIDGVISQYSKRYLEHLTEYNALLKQRNSLLKQYEDHPADVPEDLITVLNMQLASHAEPIYHERAAFIERFVPIFQDIYNEIAGGQEEVSLRYLSQLHDRNLEESLARTLQRDLILGWTSQGIHKDDLEMMLDGYPIRQVGSQGQQKTYLLALKLAQAIVLSTPILLLDDIFDRLDSERVERIIRLVLSDRFGQVFLTDTDRQHLTDILRPYGGTTALFHVENGIISVL